MSKIIQFNNVCKEFKISTHEKGLKGAIKGLFKPQKKTIYALQNVSFEIEEGDIVGYIGPNGAGKSTTVKIMSGILTPSSGECQILGFTPWKDRKKYVKNIGVVFGQKSQLWWDVPVIDSLDLLKDIYKIPNEEYKETLELLIKKLNLSEIINRPLRQLSLGQKMKCEFAGSLIHRPKILFLDEPTIGLDAVTKLAVREFIKFINKEWKTTIILTTHDMSDIEALTNKIILIGKGQILYNGSCNAIKEKYGNNKTIEVEFAKSYPNVEFSGYELISHNKNIATYKNMSDVHFNTYDFISSISQKFDVIDFSVKAVSVDEILANMYKDLEL